MADFPASLSVAMPCSFPCPFTAGTLPGLGVFGGFGLSGGFFGCFFEKGHSSSEGFVSTAATLFDEDTAPIRDTCLGYNKAGKDYFYSGGKGETEAAHIPLD